jgi:hypothetical protein
VGCVSGIAWLTILGGLAEIGGLSIVAHEITRMQRQEFGRPVFLVRLEGWLRRLLRRSRNITVQVRPGRAVASGGEIRARVTRRPAVVLEDRLARLEQVTDDLRQELDETAERLERRVGSVHQRVGSLEAHLDRRQQVQEQARKASVKREITVQALGTALFVVGVVLSVLGSGVAC